MLLIPLTNIPLYFKFLVNLIKPLTLLTDTIKYKLNLINKGIDLANILIPHTDKVLHHPSVILHQNGKGLDGLFAHQEVVEEDCSGAHLDLVLGATQDVVERFQDLQLWVVRQVVVQALLFVV
jgi:hypothetical protein